MEPVPCAVESQVLTTPDRKEVPGGLNFPVMGGRQLLHQSVDPAAPRPLGTLLPCSARTCYQISLLDGWRELGLPRAGAPQFHPQHPHSRMASYLMKPRNTSSTQADQPPGCGKGLGAWWLAPVLTMRLNIYTSPTWNRERQHLSSPEIDKPAYPNSSQG